MHLNSCCVLFLLALVACQAAPSSKDVTEQSISEAETFAKNDIQLENTGAEKDRAKKSATTFCVEVRSGKPEQVPCRQEVRPQRILQEQREPLVIVQPIPISAPVPVEYPRQPIVIQTQPQQPQQVQPPQGVNVVQQQQSTNNQPQPQVVQTQPMPAPVAVQAPAPPPTSIINIVPSAPTSVPCNKPTVMQPEQPQQVHTIHHVIHPQQTPRPSVTVIQQEVKQQKMPPPRILPRPQQQLTVIKQKPLNMPCTKEIPVLSPRPVSYVIQSPPAAYVNVNQDNTREETYECNCRPENRIPTLTPYLTRISTEPRSNLMMANSDMPIESIHSMQPSMMSSMRSSMMTENNPNMMSDQPVFFVPSEGANREAEGRHHKKKYSPLNLSVQFPLVYPESNSLKYEPVYQPVYTYSPNSYTYPSSYTYPTYGTSYPVSYDSQASASVPSITVNAGGPFYRESQHIDSTSQSNEDMPKEMFSTATEITDASNNQKRETDIQKDEQEEITEDREGANSIN